MKSLIFLLVMAPSFALMQPNLEPIKKALSKGDIETLSTYFDETVEIAVGENEDIYDKAQAKDIVGRFFADNAPKTFSEVHKGTSKGNDAQYFIGNLVAGGKSYRTYLFMKVGSEKYLIQELRIESE